MAHRRAPKVDGDALILRVVHGRREFEALFDWPADHESAHPVAGADVVPIVKPARSPTTDPQEAGRGSSRLREQARSPALTPAERSGKAEPRYEGQH